MTWCSAVPMPNQPGTLNRVCVHAKTHGTGGVVLPGFALALGANAFVIGLIAAIQVGANLLLRAFRSLERQGNRKAMAIKFAATSRVVWFLIQISLKNYLNG